MKLCQAALPPVGSVDQASPPAPPPTQNDTLAQSMVSSLIPTVARCQAARPPAGSVEAQGSLSSITTHSSAACFPVRRTHDMAGVPPMAGTEDGPMCQVPAPPAGSREDSR